MATIIKSRQSQSNACTLALLPYSIAAEDWDGDRPRLEGVRSDVDAIASELAGARFSLIPFDSTAVLRTPLTDDAAAVVTAASVMNQEITYYSSGSSITEASDLLAERLQEAREADPERANVVYYLGDGEQTADEAPGSFAASARGCQPASLWTAGSAPGSPTSSWGRTSPSWRASAPTSPTAFRSPL